MTIRTERPDNTTNQKEAQPHRLCVGCGQQVPKAGLERFIYDDEAGLVFDLRSKAPGRGAYVHPELDCLKRAVQKGGFSRGFKRRVAVDFDSLLEQVRNGIRRRLDEGLRIASASGHLVLGAEAVAKALAQGRAGLVLVADNAGSSTRRKYIEGAKRKDIPVREALTGEEIGAPAGREFAAVAAIADSPALDRIRRDLERLARLRAP